MGIEEFAIKEGFANMGKKKAYFLYHIHSISLVLVTLGSLSLFVLYIYTNKIENVNLKELSNLVDVSNAGILLLLLVLGLPTRRNPSVLEGLSEIHQTHLFHNLNEERISNSIERSHTTIKSINLYWRITMFILFAYYFLKTGFYYVGIYGGNLNEFNPLYSEALLDFVNIASSLSFFMIVLMLAVNTYDETTKKTFIPGIGILAGVFAFMLFTSDMAIEFVIKDIFSKIIISLFIGLFSAVVVTLFTGRIDSKFMRVPGIWIGLLYIYAIVLFLLPIINFHLFGFELFLNTEQKEILTNNSLLSDYRLFNKEIVIYLFMLSFALKIVLALLLIWLFRSGLILFYIVRMNHLRVIIRDEDKEIYKNFKEANNIPSFRELFPFLSNKG